jgi:hypothetical protein
MSSKTSLSALGTGLGAGTIKPDTLNDKILLAARLTSHALFPNSPRSLMSRLTLNSASKQIALRMNARSPFLADKRSDNSQSGMISENERITC